MYRRLCLALATAAIFAGTAGAAGFSIYEHGGAATAQAGAVVARASDPSAIFYNPAGIASQPAAVSFGATLIQTASDFAGDNPFPGVGVTEDMKSGLYYPPHAYLVMPVGGPLTFGFGFFAPFGLGTEWEDDFSGRASSTKSVIQTLYFNPVLAAKLGPLSVAGGVQAVWSSVELNRIARKAVTMPPSTEYFVDVAKLHLTGSSESISWGYNAGVRYQPIPQVVLGASYRAKATIDYTGEAVFTNKHDLAKALLPDTTDVATQITYPAIIGLGLAVTPIPKLTIEANVTQMQWSTFDSLGISFTDPTYASLGETIPELYENARSYRIGAEYQLLPNLALRAGYLYDESPVPTESVSTLLPDADRNSAMIGVGYSIGKTTFDLSYMYLKMLDRSTESRSRSGIDGLYRSSAHLYGLTIVQRF